MDTLYIEAVSFHPPSSGLLEDLKDISCTCTLERDLRVFPYSTLTPTNYQEHLTLTIVFTGELPREVIKRIRKRLKAEGWTSTLFVGGIGSYDATDS
jgi:hypothetical protein